MTPYNATRETPYFLAFGVEVVVLVEINLPVTARLISLKEEIVIIYK